MSVSGTYRRERVKARHMYAWSLIPPFTTIEGFSRDDPLKKFLEHYAHASLTQLHS